MGTEYEPRLLVGSYLVDVEAVGEVKINPYYSSLREHLESEEGMLYTEDCGFVGYELPTQQILNIHTVQEIGKVAKEFEKVTGVRATIKACVYIY